MGSEIFARTCKKRILKKVYKTRKYTLDTSCLSLVCRTAISPWDIIRTNFTRLWCLFSVSYILKGELNFFKSLFYHFLITIHRLARLEDLLCTFIEFVVCLKMFFVKQIWNKQTKKETVMCSQLHPCLSRRPAGGWIIYVVWEFSPRKHPSIFSCSSMRRTDTDKLVKRSRGRRGKKANDERLKKGKGENIHWDELLQWTTLITWINLCFWASTKRLEDQSKHFNTR